MRLHRTAVAGALLAGALALSACGGSGDSGTGSETGAGGDSDTAAEGGGDGAASTGIVTVNGQEPQNPLLPANTNEVGGGRIMQLLFAGLVYYDAEGAIHNEIAESIETEDSQTDTITIEDGWTFTDGSPVTASSFVDA